MNKKRLIIIIGVIVTIVSALFTFTHYKSNNSLVIYTTDDSYAYTYAKLNMIETFNVSDSNFKDFYRVWEDFKFNEENGGLVITKYEGVSEELIIPTSYDNKKFTKIEEGALPSSVKRIFLPDTVKEIKYEDYVGIEILCYKGTYCDELKSNEMLNVTVLDDVDRYILKEDDELEFTYNIKNNEIELTNYIGNSDIVLIPESINGYKVTSINFDGVGINKIYIPSTVKTINGDITSSSNNKAFIVSLIILIVALAVYIVSVLTIKIFEIVDKIYVYVTSLVYLAVINYLVYILRVNTDKTTKFIIYTVVISVIYLFVSYMLGKIIKNNRRFDEEIKHKDDFIKEVKLMLQDYDLPELKEINEMIRFSDPVSINEVEDIENEIKKLIKTVNKENVNEVVDSLKKLITKRNTIIKDAK